MTGSELSREARAELRTASKSASEIVAKHLVMAGRLVDEDPQAAFAHAEAARRILPRLAVVREAVGLCAYAKGEWALALAELRASRRINGSIEHLPIMADCERGLGRPERALAIANSLEAAKLGGAAGAELRIVIAGVRRDLGQLDAAVVALQGPDLDPARRDPWSARIFYAYADALLAGGRAREAREWFLASALADADGATDAVERVNAIDSASIDRASIDSASIDRESELESGPLHQNAPGPEGGAGSTIEGSGDGPEPPELVLVFEEPRS